MPRITQFGCTDLLKLGIAPNLNWVTLCLPEKAIIFKELKQFLSKWHGTEGFIDHAELCVCVHEGCDDPSVFLVTEQILRSKLASLKSDFTNPVPVKSLFGDQNNILWYSCMTDQITQIQSIRISHFFLLPEIGASCDIDAFQLYC